MNKKILTSTNIFLLVVKKLFKNKRNTYLIENEKQLELKKRSLVIIHERLKFDRGKIILSISFKTKIIKISASYVFLKYFCSISDFKH